MKRQRDKLKQYRKKLTLVIQREREIAKELLRKGERNRAMLREFLVQSRKKSKPIFSAKVDSYFKEIVCEKR